MFDATFYQLKKETMERHRRRWEALYGYNQHLQNAPPLLPAGDAVALSSASQQLLAANPLLGKRVTLDDLPVALDRVPNPFDSCGEDAGAYDWLTSAAAVRRNLLVAAGQTAEGGSDSERLMDLDSMTHAFVHHQSIYNGKVLLVCLVGPTLSHVSIRRRCGSAYTRCSWTRCATARCSCCRTAQCRRAPCPSPAPQPAA